jgi:hypothetical protein
MAIQSAITKERAAGEAPECYVAVDDRHEDKMSRIWAPAIWALLAAVLAGCGDRGYDGERRYPLSGKVTVDDKPMGLGVISFLPQEKGGRVSGGPIKDGVYSVPEARGANAGKYRVEIHWNKLTGRKVKNPMVPEELIDEMTEGLPAKYHQDSELTADVSADRTTFDFNLTTK